MNDARRGLKRREVTRGCDSPHCERPWAKLSCAHQEHVPTSAEAAAAASSVRPAPVMEHPLHFAGRLVFENENADWFENAESEAGAKLPSLHSRL